MVVANDLLEQALGLPEDERARIGIALIDSVGSGGSPEEVEKAWHEEIRRRLDEADAGDAQFRPWREVREELDRKLRDE
jgi:putative addiction module component (TIGR02574 family)